MRRNLAHFRNGLYLIPISDTVTRIHVHLGKIKKTNDGRWKWVRWSPKDFCPENWNGNNAQGCETTEELAILKILEGWT